MALNSTTSWSPPPIEALNFTNCEATGAYFASAVTLNSTLDIGYNATFDYLRSLVPLNSTDDVPKDWELLLWVSSWDPNDVDEVLDKSFDTLRTPRCDRAICPFLPLEGDPDLAGIGMMVSYYLVAFLATVYPIVISMDSVVPFRGNKAWRKIHSWFHQTLNAFLDASLLFSISMLLAAIYRFSSAYRNPNGDTNTFIYYLINVVTVAMFSVFPPLILQFTARNLRRRAIRATLWFLVIAFVITLTILYYIWRGPVDIVHFFFDEGHYENEINRHMGRYMWLIFCDLTDLQVIQSLDRAIITAQVVLSLNLPSWFYLVYTIIRDAKRNDFGASQDTVKNDSHHTKFNAWNKYSKYARALNILVCYVTMWLLLGTFTAIAVRLADAMGPWGKDRRWSIGQILAMATFVPLIIDIGAIVLDEPRRALEGKLPSNLRVVEDRERAEATNEGISRRFAFNNKRRQADYEMVGDGARTPRN